MRILLAVQFLLLSVACDPPASEDSSPGANIVSEPTEQFKAENDDLKDLNEELAQASVPVSAGYLTFKVNKSQNLKNIDAYVVGSEDMLTAESLDHETFIIKGIPTGDHDVIITGLLGENLDTTFDHGIKMTKSIPEDGLDLGELTIPKAGSLSGKIAMGGVSPFKLLEFNFPGTKIGSFTPNEDGSFLISHLPVGSHEMFMNHAHNPKSTIVPAFVEESKVKQVPRFNAFSKPNQPTNFIATEQEGGISLSWSSGRASTSGFIIARSEDSQGFSLSAGRTYRVGDQAGFANIIARMGSDQTSYVDQSAEIGKDYIYSIFAVNKDNVYSLPARYQISYSDIKSGFSKYRLHIYSSASSCYGWRTTAIQSIRFNFDGLWQTNNFSAETMEIIETGKDRFAYKGTIGPYSAIVSTNNLWGVGVHGYDAFYAFQDNSSAWSSDERVVKKQFPHDIKKEIWLEADFLDRLVTIEGLEIVGGEVPDFAECAPDSYGLRGSHDGVSWYDIAGSFHEEDTSGDGVRYYFKPREEPLSPIDYRLVSNPGSVYHSWTSASGSEVAYLLVRSKTPVPFNPVDGVSYEIGKNDDRYEIVYRGASTSFFDDRLASDGTVYYYSLLSFDSDFRYSDIIAEKAIPEQRQKHSYFRFHIDSIYGCTDPYYEPRAYTEELSLFIDGGWHQVIIDSEGHGSVAGKAITVRSSGGELASGDAEALFDNSRSWISPPVFTENHCNSNVPVYVELQFSEPVSLTGYRVRAGDYIDQRGYTLYEKYYGQPDKVHWELSGDGETWSPIMDSYLDDIIYQNTEVIW